MDETPKKLVSSEAQCFLCTKFAVSKERVRVFGRSAVDIPHLLNCSLDIDVSVFRNQSDVFVCVTCYKRLLKFERAQKSFEGQKKELKKTYSEGSRDRRVKRLPERSPEKTSGVASEPAIKKEPQSVTESVKPLNFDDPIRPEQSTSNTSTSSTSVPCVLNQPTVLLDPIRPEQSTTNTSTSSTSVPCVLNQPTVLSDPIRPEQSTTTITSSTSIPCVMNQPTVLLGPFTISSENQLVYQPFPATSSTLLNPADFSSLPIAKPSNQSDVTETKVKITVTYPSKTVNKTLSPEYEGLGKAIVHGPPSRIAFAAMKCKPIRKQVIAQVLRAISSGKKVRTGTKNCCEED